MNQRNKFSQMVIDVVHVNKCFEVGDVKIDGRFIGIEMEDLPIYFHHAEGVFQDNNITDKMKIDVGICHLCQQIYIARLMTSCPYMRITYNVFNGLILRYVSENSNDTIVEEGEQSGIRASIEDKSKNKKII